MERDALFKLIAAGFGALLVAIGLGRFGYPPMITPMIAAGWLDAESSRFAAATNLAGYGIGALMAAPVMRRLGIANALALSLIAGVAAFAFSTVPLPGWLFAALRGLSGVAGGILMIAMPPLVATVVPPHWRGRANGIVFTGIGAGFLFSGTMVPMLARESVMLAWSGLTVLIALGALAAWVWRPRAELATGAAAGHYRKSDLRLVGLVAAYGSAAIGYVPHTTFFVDYVARELGLGLGLGGFMWVMAGLTAFTAPLIGGFIAEAIGFRLSVRLTTALMGLGAVLPALSHHVVVLTLSVMLGGGLMIGLASFAAGRTREIVGGEAHAPAWGYVTAAYSVLQAVGAYGASWLMATSGNDYRLVFTAAGLIVAAGVLADWLLCTLHAKRAAASATALHQGQ